MLDILDEAQADRIVARKLWANRSELCLTHSGYQFLLSNLNEGVPLMPIIIKDDNGQVFEANDLQPISLEEIDARIAKVTDHLDELNRLRAEYVDLTTVQTNPTAGAVDQPAVPTVPTDPAAANIDAGQASAVPATDTAAVNNAQVDPAAATNPTAAIEQPAAPVEPSVPEVPAQPIVGA